MTSRRPASPDSQKALAYRIDVDRPKLGETKNAAVAFRGSRELTERAMRMPPYDNGARPYGPPFAEVYIGGMNPDGWDPQSGGEIQWPAIISDKQSGFHQQSNQIGKIEHTGNV